MGRVALTDQEQSDASLGNRDMIHEDIATIFAVPPH